MKKSKKCKKFGKIYHQDSERERWTSISKKGKRVFKKRTVCAFGKGAAFRVGQRCALTKKEMVESSKRTRGRSRRSYNRGSDKEVGGEIEGIEEVQAIVRCMGSKGVYDFESHCARERINRREKKKTQVGQSVVNYPWLLMKHAQLLEERKGRDLKDSR